LIRGILRRVVKIDKNGRMDPAGVDFAGTLAATQRGEEWAAAQLWRELNPRLIRFLRARHGDAAEDVASETWIRVTKNVGRFDGCEVEFRAWFFTIARATSIDWYRRAACRPTTVGDETMLDTHAAADDPAKGALDAIDTDAALALIGRLRHEEAEAILLRVVAGLDTEQVAQMLGIRPGTVRVLQHRGLRRLAEILEAERSQLRDVTQ